MPQQNVKTILNNKDKQNTYKHLLGKYRKAVNSECYFEALLIVYAMLEDRLRSMIYHSGGLTNRSAKSFCKKGGVDTTIRDLIRDYIADNEDDSLGLSTIKNKMKIIRCLTKWSSETEKQYDDEYILLLKAQYESIDAYELLEQLEQLRVWLDYRNEIIHGLLNKNMDSLYSELYIRVEDGMKMARYFDSQCKVLKKNNKIRRYLKLQNN